MMKLAFCIFNYYPFGGLERNFLRIIKECLKRKHQVTVFTISWEGDKPACSIVTVPVSGASNHARCYSYVKNLPSYLKRDDFDLVCGFKKMPGLDLYYTADVCLVDDIRRRYPILHPLYKLTPRYRTFAMLERTVFSTDAETEILALAESQQKIYMAEYGTQPERFHPVPAGIDKARIRRAVEPGRRDQCRLDLGLTEESIVLVEIGSDFRRKGVSRSILSLAALPPELRQRTKLYVIGKGKQRPLMKLAFKLGVPDQVVFTGPIDNVPDYLAAADFLLHPAVSENTGNTIVEALIAGVPVLTTTNCGYAFHVERSGAGSVIDGIDFSQATMNQRLAELLSSSQSTLSSWRQQALDYSDKTDFYSRPETITDIIESLVRRKQTA